MQRRIRPARGGGVIGGMDDIARELNSHRGRGEPKGLQGETCGIAGFFSQHVAKNSPRLWGGTERPPGEACGIAVFRSGGSVV